MVLNYHLPIQYLLLIYNFNASTNSDRDIWFIGSGDIHRTNLLEKLKTHSSMKIRLSSDCGQSDFVFSLLGSSAAINFVRKEYLVVAEQDRLKRVSEREELKIKVEKEQAERERIKALMSSGKILKARTNKSTNIYYDHNITSMRNRIFKKELPADSIFYIRKSDVDFSTINKID